MSVYRTILVAYDGSDASGAALRQGAALAQVCKAQLHVLAVVVTSAGLLLEPAAMPGSVLMTERKFMSDAMTDAVGDLGDSGRNALTCVRDGEAAAEIIAYASEIGADLVVLGCGENSHFASWFNGATGMHLLGRLPCSTLVAIDGALKPDDRQRSERTTTISSGMPSCASPAVVLQFPEGEKPNGFEHSDAAAKLHRPEPNELDSDARSWWGLKQVISKFRPSKNEHDKQPSIEAGSTVLSPTDLKDTDNVQAHHKTRK